MTSPFNDTFTLAIAETYTAELYMAGDIAVAKQYLVDCAATEGNCWSVEPTEFIYSGGRELGFVIRWLNYPRIPWGKEKIKDKSAELAVDLLYVMGQGSCTIVYPDTTVYISRRKEG